MKHAAGATCLIALLGLSPGCRPSAAPVEAAAEASVDMIAGTVRSQGVTLHYWSFGRGKPLVVINGGKGSDSSGFDRLARLLADERRVIIYDRRGTGASVVDDATLESINLDSLIADLEALREHLGVERWDMLGHSFGGMVASDYAARHPERLEHLVLSSSAGVDLTLFAGDPIGPIHARLSSADRERIRELEAMHEAGDHSEALLAEFGQILARAYVVDDRHAPWVAQRMARRNDQTAALLTEDLKARNFDCKEALRSFSAPVLVIHGEQDTFPVEISQLGADTMPNSTLHVLEGAGHYGWLDQPEAYKALVGDFLND